MKKFITFLTVIVASVCLALTFYQFVKNDEVITVDATTVYINYGDTLSLEDIGFSRKNPNKYTTINFNAGGEEVMSIIKYDETNKCYVPSDKGGSTTITITTTNKKYKTMVIDVVVGLGTEDCPYYISNQQQLNKIGTDYSLDSHFKLVKDIELTTPHTPIGLVDGINKEFNGHFDGDYHTISNMQINSCVFGGLFNIIGANGTVCNLSLNNSTINGNFINVGTVAGICYGTIDKVMVINSNITNQQAGGNTGGVVGALVTDDTNNTVASMLRVGAYTDNDSKISAQTFLGGLAGTVDNAFIHACYTNVVLENNSNKSTGGLVGEFVLGNNSYIRESYSISKIIAQNGARGNIIGKITVGDGVDMKTIDKTSVLLGVYYNNELNAYDGVAVDSYNLAEQTTFSVCGRTTSLLKQKNTYIYYVTNSNKTIYWDNVWYLADGEYPMLNFNNKFTDIEFDDNSNVTNPDSNPNTSTILIATKQDLISHMQGKTQVSGNYILSADIDLGGYSWTSVKFTGSFSSVEDQNYTISNFNINSGSYVGFFSIIGKATISNISFKDVTIANSNQSEAVGALAGYVTSNSKISGVNVKGLTLNSVAKYTGGLVGYTSNAVVEINECNVTYSSMDAKVNNVGGLVGYSSSNTAIKNCVVKTNNCSLFGIKRVGGVVATNHGTIYNADFHGSIRSVDQTSDMGYFGGIVGINHGTATACFTSPTIFTNNMAKGCQYFLGGLCGYNVGTFEGCYVSSNTATINSTSSTNTTYMAGFVAYNTGKLVDNYCEIQSIGNDFDTTYVGGFTCYNFGGQILGCETHTDLRGYLVAGFTLYNGNNGTIDSCFAGNGYNSRATYTGKFVASIAYQLNSGSIMDSLVNATLVGNNAQGWVVGMVAYLPYTSGVYGTVSRCIANVELKGLSNKYLETHEQGLLQASQTTGTIKNCIISADANVKNVISAQYSESKFFGFTIKTHPAGSGSCYTIADEKALLSFDTYNNDKIGDFDISSNLEYNTKWYFFEDGNHMPLPSRIALGVLAVG